MRLGATSEEHAVLVKALRENPVLGEIEQMRTTFDAEGAAHSLPDGITERKTELGGRPCSWVEGETTGGVVLYLHGGGYAIGSLSSHRHVAGLFASLTGLAVAVLDYRLAPENCFPAAIDDAAEAYREILEKFPAHDIAVAGDSAGGGLAVALVAKIGELGLEQPAAVYCVSPWVDLRCELGSVSSKAAQDPVGSADALKMLGEMYLGGADASHPLASPIWADLSGAPPMLIQVGSAEVLLDDSIELARVLGHADRSVRLEIWRDMVHDWPLYHPQLPEGREALANGAAFLIAALEAARGDKVESAK